MGHKPGAGAQVRLGRSVVRGGELARVLRVLPQLVEDVVVAVADADKLTMLADVHVGGPIRAPPTKANSRKASHVKACSYKVVRPVYELLSMS